jgi:hypothetical protein
MIKRRSPDRHQSRAAKLVPWAATTQFTTIAVQKVIDQ